MTEEQFERLMLRLTTIIIALGAIIGILFVTTVTN